MAPDILTKRLEGDAVPASMTSTRFDASSESLEEPNSIGFKSWLKFEVEVLS